METGDAEGATVADAAGEDLVGVAKIVAVVPDDFEHVAEMARLAGIDSEGNQAAERFCFWNFVLHERKKFNTGDAAGTGLN